MLAAVICREYKWTWEEYQNQPAQFIDTIMSMFNQEAEESKRKK